MTNGPRRSNEKKRRNFLKTAGIAALGITSMGSVEAKSTNRTSGFEAKMEEFTKRHGPIKDITHEQIGKNNYKVVYIFERGRQTVVFSEGQGDDIKASINSEEFLHTVTSEDRNKLDQNLEKLEEQSRRSVEAREVN